MSIHPSKTHCYVLLDENNVVIQKQPNYEPGFMVAPYDVHCGWIKAGDTFIQPPEGDE